MCFWLFLLPTQITPDYAGNAICHYNQSHKCDLCYLVPAAHSAEVASGFAHGSNHEEYEAVRSMKDRSQMEKWKFYLCRKNPSTTTASLVANMAHVVALSTLRVLEFQNDDSDGMSNVIHQIQGPNPTPAQIICNANCYKVSAMYLSLCHEFQLIIRSFRWSLIQCHRIRLMWSHDTTNVGTAQVCHRDPEDPETRTWQQKL